MALCLSSYARLVSLLIVSATLASCVWKRQFQPSVLVIMVENLGFGVISCNDGLESEEESGFQTFCEESVRFTHAYTPSTMSQAVVASILTAQYPSQHGVRHNGPQYLSATHETIGELALRRGYNTSFFSGGPPIWRRSGFSQGFEIFDDSFQLSYGRLYKPATEVVKGFLAWQERDTMKGKYLSFLYLSDLQFIDAPTTNEIGELRGSSYRSQLAEAGESLAYLIKEMKMRKIWDGTDVFLIGLNGYASEARVDQIPALNLYSESTRVTLMVKPARKVRDGPFNWKIDSNVSLVDVGATIADVVGVHPPKNSQAWSRAYPKVVSLKSALRGPEPDWDEDRLILSESSWMKWKGLGNVRVAARKGPYLYIFDAPNVLFNTLTDNLELSPLPLSDARYEDLRWQFFKAIKDHGYESWNPPSRLLLEKLDIASELWRSRKPGLETLSRLRSLSNRHPEDTELLGWRAIWSLRLEDWNELKTVADMPPQNKVWSYVASANLGDKVDPIQDTCFEFLISPSSPKVPKSCSADGLGELLSWVDESLDRELRNRAMEIFIRKYAAKALAVRVAEENYVSGLKWDVPSSRLGTPDTIDLILALPEMRKYRNTVHRRLKIGIH